MSCLTLAKCERVKEGNSRPAPTPTEHRSRCASGCRTTHIEGESEYSSWSLPVYWPSAAVRATRQRAATARRTRRGSSRRRNCRSAPCGRARSPPNAAGRRNAVDPGLARRVGRLEPPGGNRPSPPALRDLRGRHSRGPRRRILRQRRVADGTAVRTERLQCDQATAVHAGNGRLDLPQAATAGINCVGVVVRCRGGGC